MPKASGTVKAPADIWCRGELSPELNLATNTLLEFVYGNADKEHTLFKKVTWYRRVVTTPPA